MLPQRVEPVTFEIAQRQCHCLVLCKWSVRICFDSGKVLQLGHDRFLQNPFQFVVPAIDRGTDTPQLTRSASSVPQGLPADSSVSAGQLAF
jgi:hypothetical protein